MSKNIFISFFLFFALILSTSLFAENKTSELIKKLNQNQNFASNFKKDEVLLVRRSGGRSGFRGFSSRRSSSRRSYSPSRSSSRRSYGRSYRSGGSNFIYVGGGRHYGRRGYYDDDSGDFWLGFIVFILVVIVLLYIFFGKNKNPEDGYYGEESETFNTIKLQFAFHSTAEDFERELKKLAEELDYDNEEDLKTLVNETSMMIIQNQDYIKYAYVKQGNPTRNIDVAERDFDNFINEETAKFSQITFQNRGGKIRSRELSDENKPDFMEIDEYFIVSLIVSYANTEIKLKKDNYSWEEYSDILRQVSAIPTNNIVAAEIIWTPDAQDDILTEDDIITHYPYMIQL